MPRSEPHPSWQGAPKQWTFPAWPRPAEQGAGPGGLRRAAVALVMAAAAVLAGLAGPGTSVADRDTPATARP